MDTENLPLNDSRNQELNVILPKIEDSKQLSVSAQDEAPNIKQICRLSTEISNNIIDSVKESFNQNQTKNESENSPLLMTAEEVVRDVKNGTKASIENIIDQNGQGSNEKQSTETLKVKEETDFDTDTTFGCGRFRPKWLQRFARIETYVILYSIMGVFHGSIYTYLIGSISTLEKRFAFRSKISGSLLGIDEITPSVLGIIVGYIGGKAHRPRLLAIGMVLSSACCYISSLPYFIYGPAKHLTVQTAQNVSGAEYCDADFKKESCGDDSNAPPTVSAVVLLLFALFIKGFSNITMVIGIVYMDDNSPKRNVPLYIALNTSFRILGPVCGYLISSFSLKFYENPFEDPGFDAEDPRWIGAWWMGFIVLGTLILIFAIPLFLFPRRLSTVKRKIRDEEDRSLKEFLKGLLLALKRLGKNPLYVTQVIITIFSIYGSLDFYMMIPKYMENQFRLSASEANLYSGPPPLAGYLISTVIGGYLTYKYKPGIKLLLGGNVGAEFIFVIGFLALLFPQCEYINMKNYGYNNNGLILTNECNVNCNCTQAAFAPFCGPDGKTTFFSPCFAGCIEQEVALSSSKKVYNNCSCVPSDDGLPGGSITEGYCPEENCWWQALSFITILPIPTFIAGFVSVSRSVILLRSIHPDDKSVALGTFETLLCIFAFLPLPVLVGSLVDSACLIWEETCGETGNCWFYDIDKFKYLLLGFSACVSLIASIGFALLYPLHNRVRDLYAEEDDSDSVDKDEKNTKEVVTKL